MKHTILICMIILIYYLDGNCTNNIITHHVAQNDTINYPQIIDDDNIVKQNEFDPQNFEAYIHLGINYDFFVISSDDIEKLLDPFELGSVGFGRSFYGHIGFRNILQVEYRSGFDKNNIFHDEAVNFKIVRTKIPLKLEYDVWAFKVNPFFSVLNNRCLGLFLMYGTGDIKYIDKNKDGFEDGTVNVYGIEFSWLSKYLSAGISIESQSIEFGRFRLLNIPLTSSKPIEANNLQFKIYLSLGFGI